MSWGSVSAGYSRVTFIYVFLEFFLDFVNKNLLIELIITFPRVPTD